MKTNKLNSVNGYAMTSHHRATSRSSVQLEVMCRVVSTGLGEPRTWPVEVVAGALAMRL